MAAEVIELVKDVLENIKTANDKNIHNSIKKDDVRDLLNSAIESSKICVDMLSGEKDLWNKTATFCMNYLPKSHSPAKNIVKDYIKKLKGKAAVAESKGFLMSLLQANMIQLEILNEADKKFNTLIQDDSIALYNTRISNYLFLYYLQQAEVLSNFTIYLTTFIVQAVRQNENNIPKYRVVFMLDHVNAISSLVTDMLNGTKKYNIVDGIKTLRDRFADIELNSETSIRHFLDDSTNIVGDLTDLADNILSTIGAVFTWVPKLIYDPLIAFDDYKRHKYEKTQEEKAWMEQHVAMLKMEMNGVDPTSPEYIKTAKIIEAYDAKITDYDREINEFEEKYK